jgi:hypothetical protein
MTDSTNKRITMKKINGTKVAPELNIFKELGMAIII